MDAQKENSFLREARLGQASQWMIGRRIGSELTGILIYSNFGGDVVIIYVRSILIAFVTTGKSLNDVYYSVRFKYL